MTLGGGPLRYSRRIGIQIAAQGGAHGLHAGGRGHQSLTVGRDRGALAALKVGRELLKLALQSARLVA